MPDTKIYCQEKKASLTIEFESYRNSECIKTGTALSKTLS